MSAVTYHGPPGAQDARSPELYVYYRVHLDQAAAALAAFEAARDGQPVRLLKRRDHDPVFQTWMEIYAPPLADAVGVEAKLAAALGPFAQGPRHREVFAALAGPVGGT
ncbi:DUF4936 family protein [Roseateles sp. SL47]|uniref:DUF4936 family protein n=1 Tax=Roseateles sp. SL47 TaxID=2995138 RepID=UPI002271CED5|nr:DUF4936 family protein [Roseateles sp. SL47]WAC70913.1 DUF4936 family protein [Roseateles sp. SL47]